MTESLTLSDDEVAGYVRAYLTDQGLMDAGQAAAEVTPAADLAVLGLDSISLAGLLLTAREELVDAGRLPADATIDELPFLVTVQDLGDLLRSLAR